MAGNKGPLTPELAQRLHSAVGFLLGAGIILAICSLPLLILSLELGEAFVFALIPGAGVLCFIVGLAKLRGVTGDMLRDLGGAPVAQRQQWQTPVAPKQEYQPAALPDFVQSTVAPPAAARNVVLPPAASYPKPKPAPKKPSKPAVPAIDWEEWVGQKLLQKIGIVIVLIGMLVLLQQAFENRWIDELGRVFLALIGAAALLGAGEFFQKKYPQWSHSFTGGGLFLAYLSVWVAHVLYADALSVNYGFSVPAGLAFILYSAITAVGVLLSVRYRAQIIAWFSIAGGYLTPLLVDAAQPDPYVFSGYLAVLAVGLLALSAFRHWQGIALTSFALTEFYLASAVYGSPDVSNNLQAAIAIGFFVLFAALPLIKHFRLKQQSTAEDLLIIVGNTLVTFLSVQDALGGWRSEYVAILCIALAAFTVVCAALALSNRKEDQVLGDTYLLGSIILIALALYHQLEWEWLALGWGPLGVLTAYVAVLTKRKTAWASSMVLLAAAGASLVTQLPMFTEESWRPFLSNWSLKSYVYFASLLALLPAVRKAPKEFTQGMDVEAVVHALIALIAFAVITFEVTALHFVSSVPLSLAYLVFAVVAVGVFVGTRQIVWFATALIMQLIVFIFAFLRGDGLGMDVISLVNHPTALDYGDFPILNWWALVSILSTLSLIGLLAVSMRVPEHPMLPRIQVRHLLLGMIVAQVWLHVSVEIQHVASYFDWTYVNYHRALSVWWLAMGLTVARVAWTPQWRNVAVLLLVLPFGKDVLRTLGGDGSLADSIAWTLVSIGVASYGAYVKRQELLYAGVVGLIGTEAADILKNMSGEHHIVRSLWWPIVAAVAAYAAWNRPLRIAVVILFGIPFADDMLRILAGDARMVDTIGWTLIALVFASYGVYSKKREFLVAGVAGLLITGFADMTTHLASNDAGLLRSVWWAVAGLLSMIAGFAFKAKLLRQASIAIFGATVAKLLFVDFSVLETPVRIVASIATGLLLIGASYLYQRYGTPQGDR